MAEGQPTWNFEQDFADPKAKGEGKATPGAPNDSKAMCHFFAIGKCNFGKDCRRSHDKALVAAHLKKLDEKKNAKGGQQSETKEEDGAQPLAGADSGANPKATPSKGNLFTTGKQPGNCPVRISEDDTGPAVAQRQTAGEDEGPFPTIDFDDLDLEVRPSPPNRFHYQVDLPVAGLATGQAVISMAPDSGAGGSTVNKREVDHKVYLQKTKYDSGSLNNP